MEKKVQRNSGVILSNKERVLSPRAMVNVGNIIYLVDGVSNGLYRCDIDSMKIQCLGGLYGDSEEQSVLHARSILYKDKIYYIPYDSAVVNIYDIQKSVIEKIELPVDIRNGKAKFFIGAIADEKLYLFGYACLEVLVYDLVTKQFLRMYQLVNELKTIGMDGLYIRDVKVINDRIYAVSLRGDFILKIDAKNKCYKIEWFNTRNEGYVSIAQDKNDLWLTPHIGDSFVKYNVETEKILEKEVEERVEKWAYAAGVALEGKLYVLPCYGENPMEIDLYNQEIKVIQEIKNIIGEPTKNNSFDTVYIWKDVIIGCMPYRKQVLFYDTVHRTAALKQLSTNERPMPRLEGQIIYESCVKTLDDFIKIKIKDVN